MKKKVISLISLVLIAVVALAGCVGDKTANVQKEVKIKVPTSMVGTHPSAGYFAADVETFNEMYKGKYKAVVEEIPGDSNFSEKMMVMLTANDVPDIIFPSSEEYFNKSIENNQVLALNEYLDADPEWKASISQEGIELNSRNGKLYAIPRNKGILGYYYNKEHFEKAGIKPAETWEEFWLNCDKLKACGITPLALEPTWVGNIFLSAILASAGEDGYKLTNNRDEVLSFDNDDMRKSLSLYKKMFIEYASEDAVVAKYENAANSFINSRAAIIANGIWMTNDFADPNKAPEGFIDNVGIATFPEIIFSYSSSGIGIGSKTPEKIEASLAFLKFITSPEKQAEYMGTVGEFPDSPKIVISDELMKQKPLMVELWNIHNNTPKKTNLNVNIWPSNVSEVLLTYLPGLVSGSVTEEEVIKLLDIEAKN